VSRPLSALAARARHSVVMALLLTSVSCGGRGPAAPAGPRVALPPAFAHTFHTDATGDPADALRSYRDLVRAAARAEGDPWQVPTLQAALDALAERRMPSLAEAARDASLARRVAGVEAENVLSAATGDARGPFARSLLARSLASLAQARGDAAAAETQRQRSGCVREAVVVGPLGWAPVTGVDEEGPLDHADSRLEAAYPSGDAFGTMAHPTVVRRRGCAIDLSAESLRVGVREVLVDVNVSRAQTLGLVLRAHGAAVLRAAGTVVVRRPFELGDGDAARFARVAVTAGTLRLAARVGAAREDDSVEIDVLSEDGTPLATRAPATGTAGSAHTLSVHPELPPAPSTEDDLLLDAAATMAAGSPREAERLSWAAGSRRDARPDLALVYARAVESAHDLSATTRAERARSAYERVLEVWPDSWEAAVAHAVLAGTRRGRDEAGVEALKDLDAQRAAAKTPAPAWQQAWVAAYDAITSARSRMFDRARAALGVAQRLPGALSDAAEDASSLLVGPERAARACALARPSRHDILSCFDALRAAGDREGALRELGRLRNVLGAPDRFLPLELHEALAGGDLGRVRAVYETMLPAERTLAALSVLTSSDPAARQALLRAAPWARDAPGALAPLLRSTGDDPTSAFDGVAEDLVARNAAHPILANAGTAVLAHTERYEVSADALVHWVLFDVRRVSGTTDVEQNAQAMEPTVWGRGTSRALRRRILKKDGRVLEPERTPRAEQAHADLSQLEQGDVVEAIYEGWALPGDGDQIGIDTPDLLPERVAVNEATIELTLPSGLAGSLWSHPLLGPPQSKVDGGKKVLTWHVATQPARRVEDGVPRMDRSAAVSFTTARWTDFGRALKENVASLDDHDPEIAAWARGALEGARGEAGQRAVVTSVVAAAGAALREADPGVLSDYGGRIAPVQVQTARSFLASHLGSRSWLVVRGLRELGVPCELLVAENEPYSADAGFPPHYGRFVHPLVVAKISAPAQAGQAAPATEEVWIDADVPGPPLPAGRISPELRGRLALRPDGQIVPLPSPATQEGERDEIDLRLSLEASGDARGTFAIVLRGRAAQGLAESLVRTVGAERQRALRDVVLGWLPWANVDDVQLSSSEGSWQVSMRAQVSVSGFAQAQGRGKWMLPGMDSLHWVWPAHRVSSLAATFAERAGRESALAVSAAVQYHVHRRIELPSHTIPLRLPGPLEVKSSLLEGSRQIRVTGGEGQPRAVEDDFVLGVATGTVPPDEYDAFARAAHAIDDAFLTGVAVGQAAHEDKSSGK
jgi:hypothetical protein